MVDSFETLLRLIMISLSLGLSYFGYRLYQIFKGGLFEASFKVLVLSTLIFIVANSFSLLLHFLGSPEMALFASYRINSILEAFFIVLLFFSFYLFYKSWAKMRHK